MVNAPSVTYKLLARPENSGLSSIQYETVQRICQRLEKQLPTGERAGFLLGMIGSDTRDGELGIQCITSLVILWINYLKNEVMDCAMSKWSVHDSRISHEFALTWFRRWSCWTKTVNCTRFELRRSEGRTCETLLWALFYCGMEFNSRVEKAHPHGISNCGSTILGQLVVDSSLVKFLKEMEKSWIVIDLFS